MVRARASDYPYATVPELPEGERVDLRIWLPGDGPLELEIGPGRGAFLLERAAVAPDARLLGLEIRRKWAAVVDGRLQQGGFGGHARAVHADARVALPRLGPAGSVSVIFVHFPDPWWKKRHEKRLVLGELLVTQAARLLRDGGELFVQTDVEDRAAQYEALLGAATALEPAGDAPGSLRLAANPYGAQSNRERRVERDGLPVHRLRVRRRPRLPTDAPATSGW